LEEGTKDEIRIFEALFNGSWPKTHTLEKCTPPKRRFWKVEPTFPKPFFEVLFKGVSNRFGLRIAEKLSLPNEDFGRIDKR
jgi:hypothetical protein